MPYTDDPANVPADEVRFLLQDTDTAAPKFTDAEITYLLTKYGTTIRAAYEGALVLSARYSGQMSITVGPTSLNYGDLAQQYHDLAARLRRKLTPGEPTAGGIDTTLVLGGHDWENV